ncbi:hypothetical protein J4460_08205 [Candidatus Woesearchaeota archaeon]|nr:MAG: hypothetical protein QS99_C0012G0053 [archaeon GW2011_AR4]MBS3130622.1 hypothetical protein [Candidatus Woesearchaeota archaeon]
MATKLKAAILSLVLILGMLPFAAAETVTVGSGVGINVGIEDFVPRIWMNPESRILTRNPQDGSAEAVERVNNYAFEGEQIVWDVLVWDKNGIEKISDVRVTLGVTQGEGNDVEANCDLTAIYADGDALDTFWNARIDEEVIEEFDADTMATYTCTLTVETPLSMQGEYWVVAEVEDLDGLLATFDENEYWFFNPEVAISIDGTVDFGDEVRPGTVSYSDTLRITNDVEAGSGVLLDMMISGTDFFDPASQGSKCPVSNVLRLNNGGTEGVYEHDFPAGDLGTMTIGDQFVCDQDGDLAVDGTDGATGVDHLCYFATNGAYQTGNDDDRDDAEGYVGIPYETGTPEDRAPIISTSAGTLGDATPDAGEINLGGTEYFAGNVLTPGADISLTFKLALPEPCNGDFSDGSLFFWGEAI